MQNYVVELLQDEREHLEFIGVSAEPTVHTHKQHPLGLPLYGA